MRWFWSLPAVLTFGLRGGRGRQPSSVSRAFGLVVLAVVGATPATALAADDVSLWPIWGAAALQMGIAIIVGLVQASQARYVRLADGQIDLLRREVEQIGHELRELRDRSVPRSEIDPRMSRLSEKLTQLRDELQDSAQKERAEHRQELKELRNELAEMRADVARLLAFLQPRS